MAFFHLHEKLALWFDFVKQGDNNGDTLDQWRYPLGYGIDKKVELQKWHHVSISSIKEGGKVRCEYNVQPSEPQFKVPKFLPKIPDFEFESNEFYHVPND